MGSLTGIKMNNTTSYHPQSNGLVERLHRQLKASIMARSEDFNWMDHLPLAMLGIRTAWRTELECSPAELVYGTSLTVPGSLVGEAPQTQDQELPTSEFVLDLFKRMGELQPTEMAHHTVPQVQVPSSIGESKWVYVRTDAVRQPLVRPYTGPYKVIDKSAKYFTIIKNGRPDTVSLDRLKPAFLFEHNNIASENSSESSESRESNVTQPSVSSPPQGTREVPPETTEVAPLSYRDALCRDPASFENDRTRPGKRTYNKRKPEVRQESATLRSGRISRPPVRL